MSLRLLIFFQGILLGAMLAILDYTLPDDINGGPARQYCSSVFCWALE